ncbi:hypothetical protein NDU88_005719 [Pleurodeles waltl]|uniref:Uncharacterized protein n=1 Tax=Pleurodeles waltl TaxID=8319 RepID=A0AAV7QHY3_PLEWA|nr:hypothetical protein NDU88_005719 [Pleurodeles waltl]
MLDRSMLGDQSRQLEYEVAFGAELNYGNWQEAFWGASAYISTLLSSLAARGILHKAFWGTPWQHRFCMLALGKRCLATDTTLSSLCCK